jgi:hypothetical protein
VKKTKKKAVRWWVRWAVVTEHGALMTTLDSRRDAEEYRCAEDHVVRVEIREVRRDS